MKKYKDGDYNCDKCNYLGNFNNGDMFGVGKNNMEKFLCNDCLNINYMCDNCGGGFNKEEIIFKEDNSLCVCCNELFND